LHEDEATLQQHIESRQHQSSSMRQQDAKPGQRIDDSQREAARSLQLLDSSSKAGHSWPSKAAAKKEPADALHVRPDGISSVTADSHILSNHLQQKQRVPAAEISQLTDKLQQQPVGCRQQVSVGDEPAAELEQRTSSNHLQQAADVNKLRSRLAASRQQEQKLLSKAETRKAANKQLQAQVCKLEGRLEQMRRLMEVRVTNNAIGNF
jgi:hypothetical protein